MQENPGADAVTRFVLEHLPVRGVHVRLEGVWQEIVARKHYPSAVQTLLGELLAAAVLLAGNLKFSGSLIAQVQGTGALKLLVAEATSDHTCRAVARWDENAAIPDTATLQELAGPDAMFVLTLQPDDAEPWQGMVALEGADIAQMLGDYMRRSEQLATELVLAANAESAAGLLLQRLPEQNFDENAWDEAKLLAHTLSESELTTLDAATVLHRLFHEHPPRVFPAQPQRFACTCSWEKVGNMLVLLGQEEVASILAEQGSIEIGCDFCGQQYVFDEDDVGEVFGGHVPTVSPAQTRKQVQ